jgi:hypothetical protein
VIEAPDLETEIDAPETLVAARGNEGAEAANSTSFGERVRETETAAAETVHTGLAIAMTEVGSEHAAAATGQTEEAIAFAVERTVPVARETVLALVIAIGAEATDHE